MKLSYQSGTTYSKTDATITTSFDMDDLFAWCDALDATPKTKQVNAKLSELFNVKPSSYSKFSQLTESAEFHAAVDAHVVNKPNSKAGSMKKDARKESPSQQGPRGSNGGITNAVKQEIGGYVVDVIAAVLKIDAADYDITAEYAKNAVCAVFAHIGSSDFDMPAKRVKTEKQVNENLTSQLTASVKALAAADMTAEQIAAAIPNITEDDVNTMLA